MITLLHGPDEFSRTEAVAQRRAMLPADLLELNYAHLDGRKLKLDTLAIACEAFPFLVERRLVVVTDVLKHTKAGKERDALRDYLQHVPDSCDLVFVERDDIDRRNALFTYLKKHAEVQEFQSRQGGDLIRWIAERATQMDVQIDHRATQQLIEYAGNDSRTLVNELGKLASYVGNDATITAATVDLLVQDGQEQNLFAFIDDLSMRRRVAALRGVRSLIGDGQAPTYILFMLARQVRILLSVKGLAEQRLRADAIASQLGQKPFVVRKALDQVRGFTLIELTELHDRVLELDRATKTGRIQSEVALEVLVLEVCGGVGG